jgi:integrase
MAWQLLLLWLMSAYAGAAPMRVIRYPLTAVQAWVSQFATKRGPVVVQTAYSVLARMLDDAVQDGLLASNPARNVKLPKRPPRRNVYLTANQLDKLADESGRYRSLVLLRGWRTALGRSGCAAGW